MDGVLIFLGVVWLMVAMLRFFWSSGICGYSVPYWAARSLVWPIDAFAVLKRATKDAVQEARK